MPQQQGAKRRYRGHVQAEVRALTRQRILDATLALYTQHWIDELTLEDVAQHAGVTVQTVLRHFGSKDGLIDAAGEYTIAAETSRRAVIAPGDVTAAIDHVMAHYEEDGDLAMRGLAQEGRHPGIARIVERARAVHEEWVRSVFAPFLDRRTGADRRRLHAQLVAVLDVYTWKLLRRQAGLSRAATARALHELIEPLIA